MLKKKKISVRFLIPIFVISKNCEKYVITEKSFKYLKYLQNVLKDIATINFLILGSEKELSRDLTLKYFNEDEYMEYDQGGIHYFNRVSFETLNTIVGTKIMNGYNKCKEFEPDLIIFMKNNHFISKKWFEDIINHYESNIESPNFYGISCRGNISIITCIDDNNHINIKKGLICHNTLTPGEMGDACIIGIPREIYLKYNMDPTNLTELSIQQSLINLGYNFYKSNGHWQFNIKSVKNDIENVSGFLHWIQPEKDTLENWNIIKIDSIVDFVNLFNNL